MQDQYPFPVIKLRSFWLVLGWIQILFILYMSLTPSPPQFQSLPPYQDKIGHFLSYLGVTFWFSLCSPHKEPLYYLSLFFLFSGMGIAVEFLQHLLKFRTFEIYDIFANTSGALAAFGLAQTPLRTLLLKGEKKIFPFLNN